ncbi:MAG: Hint domain-containing protein, partial [Dehalococcoidia bacterium]|nr:Hint domain-containing protein [Dehalococcoidia bacterium]
MRPENIFLKLFLLAVLVPGLLLSACKPQPEQPPVVLSLPELKYKLLDEYKDIFWCDPEFYPVGRPGVEEKNSLEQFPAIRADKAEFSAILKELGLPDKADYSDVEKLAIYREHKKLTYPIQMTATTGDYQFSLRVGEGQGQRLEGTITTAGRIKVTKREPSFNTCPICLAKGTLIDTPAGPVPVERLSVGTEIWTVNSAGEQIPAPIVRVASTPVPPSFRVVRVTLQDGRSVTASPGHPTADDKALGDYQMGDILDGSPVKTVE